MGKNQNAANGHELSDESRNSQPGNNAGITGPTGHAGSIASDVDIWLHYEAFWKNLALKSRVLCHYPYYSDN